jgi:hypothetical protein
MLRAVDLLKKGVLGSHAAAPPNLLDGLDAVYDFSQSSGNYLNLLPASHPLTRQNSYQIGGIFGKCASGADVNEATVRYLSGGSDAFWNIDPTKSFTFAILCHNVFNNGGPAGNLIYSGYVAWGEYLLWCDYGSFIFVTYNHTGHADKVSVKTLTDGWWGNLRLVFCYYNATATKIGIVSSQLYNGLNTAVEASVDTADVIHQNDSHFGIGSFAEQVNTYQWGSACHFLGHWNRVLTTAEMLLLLNNGKFSNYPFTAETLDATYKLVFDGDSFTARRSYPLDTLYLCGRGHPYANFGHGGDTMTVILARQATTLAAYDATCTKNILVLQEGNNDLQASRTAAAIYADMTTYITAAHTAGFKVALATVCPSSVFTGGQETVRLALNVLILSNTAGADATFDPGADTTLNTPTDKVYYVEDGIHLTAKGDAQYSTLAKGAIDTILAA